MPQLIPIIAAVGAGVLLTYEGAIFVLAAIALLTASTFITMALTPKPKNSLNDPGITKLIKEPAHPWRIIYGKMRVGGVLAFLETTDFYEDKNSALYLIIVIAGHEIDGVETYFIDDKKVTLDGSGFVQEDPFSDLQAIRITLHTGAPGQTADADFLSENIPNYDYKMTLTGKAYLAIRLRYSAPLWPAGIPNISAVVRGKLLFDPRTSTTVWSDNPALAIRDYLTDTTYGMGATNIDSATVNASANVCEESVVILGGGEPRYTCNGAFTLDVEPSEIIRALASAMAGSAVYSGGLWYINAGAYAAPTVELDENDLAGPIEVIAKIPRRELFNRAKGTYTAENGQWQISDIPEVVNGAYLAEDNNVKIYQDFQLPFTTSSPMGQRLLKINLERIRQQITVNAPFKLSALNVLTGHNVSLTNTRFGWSNKPFEVGEWKFTTDNNGQLAVEMTLRETASTVYDWNSGEETLVDPAPNTNLPDVFNPQPPTSLVLNSGASALFVASDGTVTSAIEVSWTAALEAFIDQYEIQWKKSVSVSGPDQIAGLKLWLDADDLTTITDTGGDVSQWDDKSGNGNDVTQATALSRPTTGTDTIGGLNALKFDGIDDFLQRLTFTGGALSQPNTVFIVWEIPVSPVANNLKIIDGGIATDRHVVQLKDDDAWEMFAGVVLTANPVTINTSFVTASIFNTTSSRGYINGALDVNGDTGTQALNGITIGSRFDGLINFLNVKIGEILIYDRELSSGDRVTVEKYLSDKWSAPGAPDSDYMGVKIPAASIEYKIVPVEDGTDYDVRVRTLTSVGGQSDFITETTHTVIGKSAKPANVTNFSAIRQGVEVIFRWDAVPDVDLGGYIIRFQNRDIPATWEGAAILTSTTRGTTVTSAAVSPGSWSFAIKAVDTTGNESETETYADLTLNTLNDVITTSQEDPLWAGQKTNVTIDTGGVLIVTDATTGTYRSAEIDLGKPGDVRAWADIIATNENPPSLVGTWALELRYGQTSTLLMWSVTDTDLMWNAASSTLMWSDWSEYIPWTIGEVNARVFQFRLTLTGSIIIDTFTPTIDVLPVRDSGIASVGVTTLTVNFNKTFFATPKVVATVNSSSTAAFAVVSAISETSFNVDVYDSDGNANAQTIQWTASTD